MNEIKIAELFAGIGGFRLGLEQANHNEYAHISKEPESKECQKGGQRTTTQSTIQFCVGNKLSFRVIWANEWDKHAATIYRKNFGDKELVEGDIHKVNPKDIPDIDMLCGGFPCQPFSMAGKRQGFKDIRGTLFYEIMRIAQAKQPKILFLENVNGLRSHDNGDTFETILRTLGNAGYWWEYKVLNSRYFGVPQNRERVFIIGHLRTASTRQVFPFSSDGPEDREIREVVGTLQGGGHSGGLHSNMTAILADNLGGNIKQRERDATINPAWTLGGSKTLISHSVRSGGRGSLDRHSWDLVQIGSIYPSGGQCGRVYDVNGISPTLHVGGVGKEEDNVPKVAQALQTDGFLRSGSSFETDKPQSSRNIRRLTPIECERLQGFPDGWTEGVSDTQRYKTLGNAVTVNVIEFLGSLLTSSFPSGS